jgi:2-oxoglutarate dehydrogenase E2 component (dihydrolipoamide succinyltransferase)
MQIEIKVPTVGESINEVTLAKWLKKDGDTVEQDEMLCELESEKATFELNAEKPGKISLVAKEGDVLKIGDVVCRIETDAAVSSEQPVVSNQPEESSQKSEVRSQNVENNIQEQPKQPAPEKSIAAEKISAEKKEKTYATNIPSPAAEKMLHENDVKVKNGTGKDGRITKSDVLDAIKNKKPGTAPFSRNERKEKMSPLRRTVSKHLVTAKNTTAMLTTFNEVDMKAIMDIRARHKDSFKEKFGVNLGFMSFFTKACCYALQEFPAVNAFIDGEQIVYHDFVDISIAVSTPKGLVVPVIQNAESLSFAEIEKKVADLATRGRENKLTLEEMNGGTFTITNGGVFGSLMSTPIINLPQSAILGMHKIQERPVVVDKQIVIRPMMYVALSYDHRIVDGKESVSFLVQVKELLEHPDQLLIGNDPVKTMLEI